MTDTDISKSLGVLTEQVASVQKDVVEIKSTVSCSEKRGHAFEKHYIAEHARLIHKADAAHKRIDNHDEKLTELTAQILVLSKSVQPLIAANKILGVLGGILITSIVALIWMILIGQITLNFE